MGKAKIISEAGDGKYTIKLDFGTELRDERVEDLTKRITEMKPKIEEAKAKLQEAKAAEAAAKDAAKQATDDYIAATKAVPDAFKAVTKAGEDLADVYRQQNPTVKKVKDAEALLKAAEAAYEAAQKEVITKMAAQVDAAKKLVEAKKETAPLKLALDLLNDELKQLEKTKAYYAKLELEEERVAWCADLTEDAEGEVATIEIPGETKLILIKAGAEEGGSVDGQLMARELQSPAQVFFNAAILPGWQKWQPTYRTGSITKLDFEANTANVKLDAETSSAQKLDINQTKTLEKVPVIYMGCHAEAFEVGDKCIVRFDGMDWAAPQVVGFVDNPKACPGGIGIETDAGMFILQPPKEGGGQWKSREAKELHGGVAYAVSGGTSFVESDDQGLSRSNKRVARQIYGAELTRQLLASETFPISGLFIGGGLVRQAKVSGSTLLVGGYVIKDMPDGALPEVAITLPQVSEGKRWDMVTAAQDGSKIAVCRVGEERTSDTGAVSTHIVAVAHYIEVPKTKDAPGTFELSSVQDFPHDVSVRIPAGDADMKYAAPEWGTCASTRDSVSTSVVTGTWAHFTARDIYYNTQDDYTENCDYKSDSSYRSYIGANGAIINDSICIAYKASIVNSDRYGGESSNYFDDSHVYKNYTPPSMSQVGDGKSWRDENRQITISSSEDVTFFGAIKIPVYATAMDYSKKRRDLDVSHSVTPVSHIGSGNRSGSWSNSTITTVLFKSEYYHVLVADDEFNSVIAIKLNFTYEHDERRDFSNTYVNDTYGLGVPVETKTVVPTVEFTLELISGNTTSISLESTNFDETTLLYNMTTIMLWMDVRTGMGAKKYTSNDEQGNYSGFASQRYNALLKQVTDGLISRNLDKVQYAKDPKTGVGFLSFKWAGDTHNYVVGDWGVSPSPSKTDIASGDKVTQLVSI